MEARLKSLYAEARAIDSVIAEILEAEKIDQYYLDRCGLFKLVPSVSLRVVQPDEAIKWVKSQPGGREVPKVAMHPSTLRSWFFSRMKEMATEEVNTFIEDAEGHGLSYELSMNREFRPEEA